MRPASAVAGAFLAGVTVGVIGDAGAQEVKCGDLSARECGLFQTAMENWNKNFGAAATMVGFEVVGGTESPKEIYDLYSPNSESPTLVTAERGSSRIVSTIGHVVSSSSPEWKEKLTRDLQEYGQHLRKRVRIRWQTPAGEIESYAFTLDEYPYIIDTMLSSVLLQDTSICNVVRAEWVFGLIRGQIDIHLLDVQNGAKWECDITSHQWINLGSVAFEHGPVKYDQTRTTCSVEYAWAFATPVAEVSIGKDDLTLNVTGLGSHDGGEGTCRKQRH